MDDWELKPARDSGLSPHERARSLKREPGLTSTATHTAWSLAARCSLRVLHRLTVDHPERIPPKPPFVLIANHSSHLDALVLAAPLPALVRNRIFPIAAGDVFFETPLISFAAAGLLNALPMWRKRCGPHALAELRERLLSEPCAYILFPEGCRSRDGALLPFKAGLGMLVASTGVPVVPCRVIGAFEALPPGRWLPRPTRITLRVGEPLVFDRVPDTRPGWEEVAQRAHASIAALHPAPA